MKKLDTVPADTVPADTVPADTVPADSTLPIRFLGRTLPYRDESEERILEILRRSVDRSNGSDELAQQADDWPTHYHLSRIRSHLLRPFLLEPGLRVLEIGAGCGALSRYLGETGVQLTALEGSSIRAEACAERCAGLTNVEVVCGSLEELRDPRGFDMVLAIGVLEYAASTAGGASTPEKFLDLASALLRPDGALIVAIENQLGLKYLLGHPEDHHGKPWIGLIDYPGPPSVRTFSRQALGRLLAQSGLSRQHWLFPFPDYKLPRVILSEDVYRSPRKVELVDQLVRWPMPLGSSHLLIDERQVHQKFVDAEMGPEIANSFLVCATTETARPERFVSSTTQAWHFGDERRRCWQRMKRIESTAAGWVVNATSLAVPAELPPAGWLTQQASGSSPYFTGQTLEQLLRQAAHRHDLAALKTWLRRWDRYLADHEEATRDMAPHPYGDPTAARLLPARFLDVDTSNFIVEGEQLCYIDDEWCAGAAIDPRLARLRALWNLAHDMICSHVAHPWPASTTVDELAGRLAAEIALELTDQDLARLRQAEGALFEAIFARDPDDTVAAYKENGSRSLASFQNPRTSRFEQDKATDLATYEAHLESFQRAHEAVRQTYEQEIHKLEGVVADTEASLRAKQRETEQYRVACEELKTQLQEAHQRSLKGGRAYEQQIVIAQRAYETHRQVYEQEIEHLQNYLEEANREIETRNERRVELEESLAKSYRASDLTCQKHTDKIARLNRELSELHRERQGFAESFRVSDLACQKYTDEIARLIGELGGRDAQIGELQVAIDRRDHQIADLFAINHHQQIDLDSTRRRAVDLRGLLDTILRSPTWRLRLFVTAVGRRLLRPIKRWLTG